MTRILAGSLWERRKPRSFLQGELRGLRRSHRKTEAKIFFANAKKLLQSKKHGRKVRHLRRPRRFFQNETTMNRTHFEQRNAMPTTPPRGVDACGLRADFSRDAGIPID